MANSSRKYPEEFKRDTVASARKGETSKKQIAADVGSSETTLYRWIKRFDADEGRRTGATSDELTELAQLRRDKRRLEQENETLRRATAHQCLLRQGCGPNMMDPTGDLTHPVALRLQQRDVLTLGEGQEPAGHGRTRPVPGSG